MAPTKQAYVREPSGPNAALRAPSTQTKHVNLPMSDNTLRVRALLSDFACLGETTKIARELLETRLHAPDGLPAGRRAERP